MRSEIRKTNGIHTFFLLAGLFALLGAMGMIVAGFNGIIWAFAMSAFLVAMGSKMSQRLILQLYNARPLTKEEAPAIHDLLEMLAARAHLHCELKLYHIPSQGMNAFSVGDASEATIALTDGLLRKLRASELLAVMAHEISHIRNNDMRVMALADMVSRLNGFFSSMGLLLLFFSLPLLLLGKAFISLPFVLLLILAPALSNVLQLGLSRTREYTADLDAVSLTRDPISLIRALEKMDIAQNGYRWHGGLANKGDKLLPSLFRSHPATAKRIKQLKKTLGEFGEQSPFQFEDGQEIPRHLRPSRQPRRHINGLWY